jgi:hypothetical protein
MGDISDQMLRGVELNERVDSEAMKKLLIKKTAEKRTIYSGRIQMLLEKDPNTKLYERIDEYLIKTYGAKLSIEDLKSYLELSVHDADGQALSPIGINTNPKDPTTETVSQETYDGLKELAIDPDEAEAKVKADLDTRKIY